jgi:hypothetical protein
MKIRVILNISMLCLVFLLSCAQRKDPATGEVINSEPNLKKRQEDAVAKGQGLFGDINNIGKKSNTFEFATSNVLWRATLKSLDFMPMTNADYSGGVIVYDWYSENLNSNEYIKVTVRFLNNEIKSNSIQIITHKKICESSEKCKTTIMNETFSNNVKDKILDTARRMRIEEEKSKK